jgi:Tol biopolymer transport system component
VDLTTGVKPSSYRLIASTRNDQHPQISPDGQHIAFSSGRSGTREIWLSDAEGINPAKLTSMGGPLTTAPSWSPDGEMLAFDSRAGGAAEIFVISARGGAPRKITNGPQEQYAPSWSRDGKFLYFQSGKGSHWEIWKIATEGGAPVQITRHGGERPVESADGSTVYYVREKQLWRTPPAGGSEERVFSESIDGLAFAVAPGGMYFIPAERNSIRFISFKGKAFELLRLEKGPAPGLAVSPDGRWLLYSQFDAEGSDLMMIESSR